MRVPAPVSPYYSLDDLPIIGRYTARIGQVRDLWAFPCNPTPEIWIKAAFENVPRLIWSLTKPDPNDLAARRAIGRGAGIGRHGARGRYRRTRRRFSMQVEDSLAPLLGNRHVINWWLWRGGILAQRIGWWMLVVDATTEFLVNWTSTAYQYAGCHPDSVSAHGVVPQQNVFAGPPSQFIGWTEDNDPDNIMIPGGVVVPAGKRAALGMTINTRSYIGDPSHYGFASFRWSGTNGWKSRPFQAGNPAAGVDAHHPDFATAPESAPGSVLYTLSAYNITDHFTISDGSVSAALIDPYHNPFLPDP